MFYFIGIKGTGMAALAILLNNLGNDVTGSDIDKHFFTEDSLIQNQIKFTTFEEAKIPENSCVIIGNAFLDDFPLVQEAYNTKGVTTYRYHEFLGKFMEDFESICVTGSHGKTTTTGLISSMLSNFDETGYLIGDGSGKISKTSKYFCVEADEYRRHFLSYNPRFAIVTNVDLDHVDYFKDEEDYSKAFEEFIGNVKEAIVICGDDEKCRALKFNKKCLWYGQGIDNDIRYENLLEASTHMEFDLFYKNEFVCHYKLPFVGKHLLLNSLGVIGIGILYGFDHSQIEAGLSNFKGVKRRFVVEEYKNSIFVDDYAHHPAEIRVTIEAAKKRFPNHKIVAIFKPHRVSRVFKFADDFAKALQEADKVYLCDFTSIDDKEEGIDIDITYLADKTKDSVVIKEDLEAAKILVKENPCVYLFMSSKDIYPLASLVKSIL